MAHTWMFSGWRLGPYLILDFHSLCYVRVESSAFRKPAQILHSGKLLGT